MHRRELQHRTALGILLLYIPAYRSIVGMILYLAGSTRSYTAYNVDECARIYHYPIFSHEIGLKHIAWHTILRIWGHLIISCQIGPRERSNARRAILQKLPNALATRSEQAALYYHLSILFYLCYYYTYFFECSCY